MHEATEDKGIFIINRAGDEITYAADDGDMWVIKGVCNQCGLCEGGEPDRNLKWVKSKGEPGACIDLDYGTRKDRPIRPELCNGEIPECSLTGWYVNGE